MTSTEAAGVYDATIDTAWRLAICLHREAAAAQDALVRAYGALFADAAEDARSARTRLLALLTEQARDASPAH